MSQPPVKSGVSASLQGDPAALPAALRGLINNPQSSDVSFVVGRQRQVVRAHRCILMCRCKVFHTMFSRQSPQEMSVPFVIEQLQPEVFMAVMEFIYTNSVTLDGHIALEVLTAALLYGLTDLRKLCEDFISRTLTVDMACEALQVAVTFFQKDLHQRCLAFIEQHTQVVLDVPIPVVAQDAVRELRLVLLSPDELTALERENAKDDLIPEIQIAQAWKFHSLKKVSDSNPHHFQRRKGTLPREHHRYLDPPSK
ncbi:BTB/POZ domain-containing protein 19 isoform X2 [Hyla sarda]|uniref:BTB/POZ domain-containing protein 19 isoform X2 n=1 Tax=Hyla sarda TaxID=327740 RepID=UPI0024C448E6|nr:BTB/POZ domain-containing protein 19 isoform X2 [Hyla sarda]